MPVRSLLLFTLAVGLVPVSSAAADSLQLVIEDGRVTLDARNVLIRDILAEWARVGRTRVVNAEKIAGPPVTLRLIDVPEEQALSILLRSVAGFLAAPRDEVVADASTYDRVLILPSSQAPAAPAPATARRSPQPVVEPDVPSELAAVLEEFDEEDDALESMQQAVDGAEPLRFDQDIPQVNIPAEMRELLETFGEAAPVMPSPMTPAAQQSIPSANPAMPVPAPTGTAVVPGVVVQPPSTGTMPQAVPPRQN